MQSLAQIRERLLARWPAASITVITNPGPAGQDSLLIDPAHAREIAGFLRDEPALRFDYCSNVTGVDWPAGEKAAANVPVVPPSDQLEVVYHLYSMALKHGPLVLRLRTVNRSDQVNLPSLTPVWRACEFQEREVFDLFGVVFDGHPDLRRILMWDEFKDHPMRRDYVAPDDFEWEPTPHDDVLARAKHHYPAATAVAPVVAVPPPANPHVTAPGDRMPPA